MLSQSLDQKCLIWEISAKNQMLFKSLWHWFVMEDFVNDFQKQKGKIGFYLGDMDGWWVQVYARAQSGQG